MAGHRRRGAPHRTVRTAAGLGLAAALLAPALLTGCTSGPKASEHTVDAVQQALDARAAAVLARDENAYLAALAPELAELRADERRQFRNLADVPFGSWEYRVGKVERDGPKAVAEAHLRYRFAGYDIAPVAVPRVLELGLRDGRWYVTADRPGKGAAEQLWEQGDVSVVRGHRSLVLAVDQEPARLRALAATADRAVPAVSASWRSPWAQRVVVLVPGSVDAMGALLGTPSAGYRGIAAVTTGETGTTAAVPADRVIVNPSAYGLLGDFGRNVVLTHETTHVATRAYTSPATPMWLSEGFADWVAYRGTARTAGQNAPELQRAVREGELPAGLPSDEDFSFGGDADALARAYEGGWLACDLIAERWGEEKLTELYREVGSGKRRGSALRKAMSDILSTTPEDFTARWRDHLRARLG
ncbi:hypothetical protein ACFYT4_18860 [Streptomyces sp. NPDC004609]|uniref:hypothetical protein n=1 Tax=Streptomyces sp. NPDC004609 TaxID=3364704 RepID=UPI0036CCD58D